MVNKERITNLLQQFADGVISKEEYIELTGYFNLIDNDEEIFAAMNEIWKNIDAEVWHSEKEVNQIYQNLIHQAAFKSSPAAKPVRKLWYRIAAAALLFASVSAGLYFNKIKENAPASERFAKQDIAPGGNRAMLTLANGKKINLTAAVNGELANESGISVSKTKNGQLVYTVGAGSTSDHQNELNKEYNTITTPRGGQYQVNLPDGTTVWLNAASSLKFPVKFSRNERKVTLDGEAYFEVAKVQTSKVINGNAVTDRMPFIVETSKQDVKVLGTHFNINAYEGSTKTTLLEGAVSVSPLHTAQNLKPLISYLHPGQQSILTGESVKINTADIEEAMAWKNGIFLFNGQDLEAIMKQVERWYDVDVAFEDNSLKRQTFRGTLSRFKNISQLLEVLESTGSVHFKMEGRRVTAMK